tara:strand:- start:45 stop:431 length:387 start_codon:yes stop_codon:yes gene_type:complete
MSNTNINEKTFRFYDIFDNQEHIFCDLKIIVEEKTSGGKDIYDITYIYNIPQIENVNYEVSLRTHPFFYSKEIDKHDKEGVIVYKNPMTEQLVKFLLMDQTELDQYTGGTYWIQYKIKIMESLAKFWD